ncbi:DNA binding protein [Mycobacterium phage DS6A]|uniref:Uncharacterized protein n=1 Tax=Mycobacterium phage DS6A TaxID=45764 RepID=G8I4H4_9CAUD|nr:DNA binding protein [Mycobacterium phage DS6A]AER47618.1 hypothetical protein DS6A_64 [Mycobacterium phage DS6A]
MNAQAADAMMRRRQRVGELAAAGRDRLTIAHQLGVSVRTVDRDLRALRGGTVAARARNDDAEKAAAKAAQRAEEARARGLRRKRVAELTRRGWSVAEIAEAVGVSPNTVVNDRVVTGAVDRRPKMTAAEVAEAEALLRGGLTYNEVAARLGRHQRTLAARLPGYRYSHRASDEQIAARRQRVRELTERGDMTTREIAGVLGVSESVVVSDRIRTGTAKRAAAPLTADEQAWARELLDDGAPYAEVGRTLGRSDAAIRRRFPGYELDAKQAAQVAGLVRAMSRIEKLSDPLRVTAQQRREIFR